MVTTNLCAHSICANSRLDETLGSATEEIEKSVALLSVLGILGVVDIGAAGLVGSRGVVRYGCIKLRLGRV